ncbi:MAG: FAD binding domain-containing protein [Terriglobales bacterium]
MKSFQYASPNSDRQALGLLGNSLDEAAVFAGGTDLLSLMKDDVISPKRLVNIKQVPGLDKVRVDSSGLHAGALVRIQDFADNVEVQRRFPLIAWAADEAASPQIRHMATMGGNLCQRPRCWYFRNGFGLLALKDGKSLVEEGDSRYHAIFGNDGPAKFVSPSTIAPALIVHNAKLRILGANGPREVELEKFFVIPRSENEREHDLKPNEIVAEILVPPAPAGMKTAQYEVRQKVEFDWPLAVASVGLQMSGNTVRQARVVLGHVAPIPWVSQEAAQALEGKTITEQTADEAGKAAVSQARGLGRNNYKIRLARVAVKRAVLKAAGMWKEEA